MLGDLVQSECSGHVRSEAGLKLGRSGQIDTRWASMDKVRLWQDGHKYRAGSVQGVLQLIPTRVCRRMSFRRQSQERARCSPTADRTAGLDPRVESGAGSGIVLQFVFPERGDSKLPVVAMCNVIRTGNSGGLFTPKPRRLRTPECTRKLQGRVDAGTKCASCDSRVRVVWALFGSSR